MTTRYIYITSTEYAAAQSYYKIGMTTDPIARLHVYLTGDPPGIGLEHYYCYLWEVSAESDTGLHAIETAIHRHFGTSRMTRANGSNTEWFRQDLSVLHQYIASQPYIRRECTLSEVTSVQRLATPLPSTSDTHLQKFTRIFLGGKQLRRIQYELWDRVLDLPKHNGYRGIVQWPTGTGKTVAMLILIVLLAEDARSRGLIYRGLLISPKNDIFDTIYQHFVRLSEFGITVLDGSHGRLSSLEIPTDRPILILACHSALTNQTAVDRLPPIHHCHYDEVHRITGEELYTILKTKLTAWGTPFLTGTSATPKTCDPSQHRKLASLFGEELCLLHQCTVHDAVREGWIAKPRFVIKLLQKQADDKRSILRQYVDAVVTTMCQKGKGGKAIVYLETSIDDVKYAHRYAIETYPMYAFYAAIDGDRTDDAFICAEISPDMPMFLFACQRYREGSDIRGLELTARLVINTIAAHILIQISGRALRIDGNPNKEGWCLIARVIDEEANVTEEDVLDSIVLDIAEFMGNTGAYLTKKEVRELVETYFEELTQANGHVCTLEETVDRIQAAYMRNVYQRGSPKTRYEVIRAHNRDLGLTSKHAYEASNKIHPLWVAHPKKEYSTQWISWYHFIGMDTTAFPPTKYDWITECKSRGLTTWAEYAQKRDETLPENPSECYEEYTNWEREMSMVEEHVW